MSIIPHFNMNQEGARGYHLSNFRYILTLSIQYAKKNMKNGNYPQYHDTNLYQMYIICSL